MRPPPFVRISLIVLGLSAFGLSSACEERTGQEATPPNGTAREPIKRDSPGAGLTTSALSGLLEVSVAYRERIMIPEGSTVRVTLSDVARADAPADVIAEKTLITTGGPPFVVELEYDPARIDHRGRFAVSARIEHDGRLLFITDTSNPVLTGGAPKDRIEVIARSAG